MKTKTTRVYQVSIETLQKNGFRRRIKEAYLGTIQFVLKDVASLRERERRRWRRGTNGGEGFEKSMS